MEDILVGQVEEVAIKSNVMLRVSGRWYNVRDPLSLNRVLLSDKGVLMCAQDLVASDDFTELMPVD